MSKTKSQVFALAKKHNCEIEINIFRYGMDGFADYDITIDAPENYGFACGDLSAICINNSYLETCNTAKAFWTMAYSELETELKYLKVK